MKVSFAFRARFFHWGASAMSYELKVLPGETVLLDIRFQPSRKSEPFHFAVSTEALYLPAKKLIALSNPYYFRRVPHAEVRRVSVEPVRPAGAWVGGILMVLAGLALGALWLSLPDKGTVPRVLGWALALIAGGVLMPWAAKGRQRLSVMLGSGAWRWNPPFVVDAQSKRQVQDTLESILDTCRSVGLPVAYEAEADVQRLV